jgi:hypothetical protein
MVIERDTAIRFVHLDGIGIGCLEERAGHYEKTHAKHNWWDWYAPYLSARQDGSSPEEASAAADRYMDGGKK